MHMLCISESVNNSNGGWGRQKECVCINDQ